MTIHLCHQSRQLGAFSKEQVEAMLKGGVVANDTLAWTSGLSEWKALINVLGPTTPPPIPPPSAPTNHMPKECGIPPIITTPPITENSQPSEAITRELQSLSRDTRLGFWCTLAWIGAIIFIAASSKDLSENGVAQRNARPLYKEGIQVDPQLVAGVAHAPALFLLIAALRGVARKATATVLVRRHGAFHNFARDVYLPAIWGTLWRSAIPVFLSAGLSAVSCDDPVAKAQAFMTTIALWILIFPFTLDRPLHYKSRIQRLTTISQASTSLSAESKMQVVQGNSAIVAPGVLSSVQRMVLSSSSAKWVVGLSLMFAVLSITALVCLGIYVLRQPDINQNVLKTGGQVWPLASDDIIAHAQPPRGQTGAADSKSVPQVKRLGDLFPSVSRYGNPQNVVNWKSVDPAADYDSPLEFIDYPGTAEFIVPPTDIEVTVYPPGVGPVVEPTSPMARVGRERDSVLYITDTRPGACVVWVARTNSDSAADLLCAYYAVLGACGIADQEGHKYKYLEICRGGGWRHNSLTGGSLVFFPVLFYEDRPTTDPSAVQSVQEIKSRVIKETDSLLKFLNGAAREKAKHKANNSALPR